MYARALSGSIIGVEAQEVIVEAHRARGLPGLALIGLARGAAREAVVRVRSAMLANELPVGSHRLVVNLLPAELPKEASALDLPLLTALLASGGLIPPGSLEGRRFFGELSLSGTLEPVRGAVLIADLARRAGDRELLLPYANALEAAIIPGIKIIGVKTVSELFKHLTGTTPLSPLRAEPLVDVPPENPQAYGCFAEVYGQDRVKRALEIAAAGGHNLLMIGPPGSGKTMLAKRLPGILPLLSPEECIEVTRIHSASGVLPARGLVRVRPFRAPHHTASEAALCGGGGVPKPGEITLAHRGVLFLDEFPEFSRKALESLREPLEAGFINIARASMSLCFPAKVLLLAAMNPCPCGRFRGDTPKRRQWGLAVSKVAAPTLGERAAPNSGTPCLCSFDQIQRYRARISGPLLDRIDMHVLVEAVPYRDYAQSGAGESSQVIRQRVEEARGRQTARFGALQTNALMNEQDLRTYVPIRDESLELIELAIEEHGLSTRAISRILKVARTIADLAGAVEVSTLHLAEALNFRILDNTPQASN